MTENEQWYDDEIAPLLLEVARRCKTRGVSFIGAVEYNPTDYARTTTFATDAGLAIRMLDFCAQAGTNVDGYIIALMRYCRKHDIPTDSSIVLNRMSGVSA